MNADFNFNLLMIAAHRRTTFLSALACALAVAGCVGLAPMPTPTRADAAFASTHWPGTTVAQLARGRSLLLDRCGACHDPPHPDRFAPAEWPGYVRMMQGRAGLARGEAALVAKYLMTMSARGRADIARPDRASAQR